jgi:hypothetical protein
MLEKTLSHLIAKGQIKVAFVVQIDGTLKTSK